MDADLDSVNDGLSEAMATIRSEPEPAAESAPAEGEGGGRPRDERGRFKSEAEKAEAGAAGKDDGEGGQIPSWRLREIREERDALRADRDRVAAEKAEYERELAVFRRQQRMLREAEQAPQRPDLLQDPDAYAEWVQQTIGGEVKTAQQVAREQFVDLTFDLAIDQHGQEAVDAAMQALEAARDPRVAAAINGAKNPAKALMQWHKQHQAMAEVGGDIEGYNKRLRDKLKKDPEFRKEFMAELESEARGGSSERSENVTRLPSVNRAPGGGERQTPGSLGGSDQEIFSTLTAKRR